MVNSVSSGRSESIIMKVQGHKHILREQYSTCLAAHETVSGENKEEEVEGRA